MSFKVPYYLEMIFFKGIAYQSPPNPQTCTTSAAHFALLPQFCPSTRPLAIFNSRIASFFPFRHICIFHQHTRCKLTRCKTKTGYKISKFVKQVTSLISQIRATLPCREMRQKSPKMRPNWVKMRPEDPHFVCAQLGHDGRVRGTPADCNPLQLVVVVCKIHSDRTIKPETLNYLAFLS